LTQAFLALGSNLNDPIFQINHAISELATLPQTIVRKVSSLYWNPPVGVFNQPNFINAVAEIETNLTAPDLLKTFFEIEEGHLRVRKEKNGPRTLDLDLLTYGNEIIETHFLQIPHPRLKERSFVVIPLTEIAPELILPCGTPIKSLATKLYAPWPLCPIRRVT
jgi:2-amino-4-hydroxy-6-hydroxymethyldihydropteridine diphosphokinase